MLVLYDIKIDDFIIIVPCLSWHFWRWCFYCEGWLAVRSQEKVELSIKRGGEAWTWYCAWAHCVRVSLCPLRCDSVYTYRKYSVCSGSRSFHDPSQRPSHHDHPHLPTLALLQTHRGACWGGAEGTYNKNISYIFMKNPTKDFNYLESLCWTSNHNMLCKFKNEFLSTQFFAWPFCTLSCV